MSAQRKETFMNSDTELLYTRCELCPRRCGVNRYEKKGYCGEYAAPRAAKACLHMWEEPCLSGTGGSGALFFSGCSLKCIYCQNHSISWAGKGKDITVRRMSEIFLELQEKGAHNIDLITATHFVPHVIRAADAVKDRLHIPIVFNCGGYERTETIEMMRGTVSVFLPDVKYFSDDLAIKYSNAPDYFPTALKAVEKMIDTVGKPVFGENGLIKSGVIVRHMVLPSHRKDSDRLLREIAHLKDDILLSLMSQYTPFYRAAEHKELSRRLSTYEYEKVRETALSLGFNGYSQERTSAKEEYTPEFDMEGI